MQTKATPGIVERHSRVCASRTGAQCSCEPAHQAWVWLPREGKKKRKTFSGKGAKSITSRQTDPNRPTIHCFLDRLEHLTDTLWRAHVKVEGGGLICYTFDAAKYVPGSDRAQNIGSCP